MSNFNTNNKKGISWICRNRDCSGRIHTDLEVENVLKSSQHNHADDKDYIDTRESKDFIDGKRSKTKECFEDVITEVCEKANDEAKKIQGKYESIRDCFTRKKRNLYNETTSIHDDVPQMLKSTICEQNSLFFGNRYNNQNRIIMLLQTTI